MDKDAKHESYTEFFPVWKTCRDACTGQRAIHKGGEMYLPRLSGQSAFSYEAYKRRANFFNATGRTVEAMQGLVFRKQPVIELPTGADDWYEDINMQGKSLEGLAVECVEEVLKVGRGGILVDYPQTSGETLTIERARALNLRPYMTFYKAEDIEDWKYIRIGNVVRLGYLKLREIDDQDETKHQWRVLELRDGIYTQTVWKDNEGNLFEYSFVEPIKGGQKLSEIPFYPLAPKEPDMLIQDPPIEDLVYVNISHYQNSADLENGAHVAGLPTPYVTGIEDENFVFQLGGNGIVLPSADCTAGFIQCGSEGFASLEKLMDRKEQQMAALGARLIAPEKKAAETAETTQTKRGGENSVLASIAASVEQQIRKALVFMMEWAGISGEPVFELNKDYVPVSMSAQELKELVAANQAGAISDRTLFECLQQGEIISEGLTFEEEQDRKQEQPPSFANVGQ